MSSGSNGTDPNAGLTIDQLSPYGYVPSRAVAIVFLSLFGLSTSFHLFQALYFRLWFLLPSAVLCGLGELIGWSGRLWSSINPLNSNAFLIQISTTIIAPTPLVAANFIMLGTIINRLGQQYSRLNSRWYTRIFLSCDIIALATQGLGGGLASTGNDQTQAQLGGHIALGGIVFQLVCIILYSTLTAEFLWRYANDFPVKPTTRSRYENRVPTTPRLRIMLIGMTTMTGFIIIRSIYRTVELADGWGGKVIETQWLFDVFDALMIVLAMLTLNIVHPGVFLRPVESNKPGDDGITKRSIPLNSNEF